MDIDPNHLIKNLQKMQEQFVNIESTIGDFLVTGSAGAGLVEVDINGKMHVEDVRIAPEVADGADVSLLQDLVACAFNDAMGKVLESIRSKSENIFALISSTLDKS